MGHHDTFVVLGRYYHLASSGCRKVPVLGEGGGILVAGAGAAIVDGRAANAGGAEVNVAVERIVAVAFLEDSRSDYTRAVVVAAAEGVLDAPAAGAG